jgi:uncharacterized integral membrane protein (TIGR00697 family)
MGAKTIPIADLGFMKLNASVSIFLLPLIFSINDVITEVLGTEKARSLVRIGIIVVALLFVFEAFAVALPSSTRFLPSEPAYNSIFGQAIRISFASLVAFGISDICDVLIFTKLRTKFKNKALWLRNNASNIIAQLIDTVVFMTLAFYAFDKSFADNWSFLSSVILPYWIVKSCMSIIETPLVYLGVKWLRKPNASAQKH